MFKEVCLQHETNRHTIYLILNCILKKSLTSLYHLLGVLLLYQYHLLRVLLLYQYHLLGVLLLYQYHLLRVLLLYQSYMPV